MKGKMKRIAALILMMMLTLSSTLIVNAETSNSRTIKRDTKVGTADALNAIQVYWPVEGQELDPEKVYTSNMRLTVKRAEDTFAMFNLIEATPVAVETDGGIQVYNVNVEWNDTVKAYLAAHSSEFPTADYETPQKLGLYTEGANAEITAANKQAREKLLINLINAMKADETTYAALTADANAIVKTTMSSYTRTNEADKTVLDESKYSASPELNTKYDATSNPVSVKPQMSSEKFSMIYEVTNIPFGLYFIDAKNSTRTSEGGYTPVIVDLIPQQTGPSGNWYLDLVTGTSSINKDATLKYEGIQISKQINSGRSDIVRQGEVVTFEVTIEVPKYPKDKDGEYVYPKRTFTAFDDMAKGFDLIASSAELHYVDSNGYKFHPKADLTVINGNATAGDVEKETYQAIVNGNCIPFTSTSDTDTELFYATKEADGTFTIWAVINGVLQSIKTNATLSSSDAVDADGTPYVLYKPTSEIVSTYYNKRLAAGINDTTKVEYTNIQSQPYSKSLIGIIFDYDKLMNPATYSSSSVTDRDPQFTVPDKIKVTYEAVVNDDSYIGSDLNVNRVVTYYVADATGTIEPSEDQVKAWTYAADIIKVDGDKWEVYEAETNEGIKAEMISNAETNPYLAGAHFNLYRLDTEYCGSPEDGSTNNQDAPTSDAVYNTFTFYREADSDATSFGASLTKRTAETGIIYKALKYEMTQKAGLGSNDRPQIGATIANAIGTYTSKTGENYNFCDYSTADKFSNKYNFSSIYARIDGTHNGPDLTLLGKENYSSVTEYSLKSLLETKKADLLADYMFPQLKTDFSKAENFANNNKNFVLYVPVEMAVGECTSNPTKAHYHLQAYALFAEDIVSTDTAAGVQVNGLDPGKYVLVETQTPSNAYNKLTTGVQFEIVQYDQEQLQAQDNSYKGFYTDVDEITGERAHKADGIYDIQVRNYSGLTLPSTGGMGTLLFTIIGIIIMIGVLTIVIIRNKKLARSAASFMALAVIVIATVGSTTIESQAVTTINLGTSSTQGNSNRVTSKDHAIKFTINVTNEHDKIEVFRLTKDLSMTGQIFNPLEWSEGIAGTTEGGKTVGGYLRGNYEEDNPGYSVDEISTPDNYKNSSADDQSRFLQWVYKNKDKIGLQVVDPYFISGNGTTPTVAGVAPSQSYYYTIGENGAYLDGVPMGIYLIHATNTLSNKSYQVLTVNAVPTQGANGSYYVQGELNASLKYGDLQIEKKINGLDYDLLRMGETVDFNVDFECPTYFAVDKNGNVISGTDADLEAAGLDPATYFDTYKVIMSDDMSLAYDYLPGPDNKILATTKPFAHIAEDLEDSDFAELPAGITYTSFVSDAYDATKESGFLVFKDSTNGSVIKDRFILYADVKMVNSTSHPVTYYVLDTKTNAITKLDVDYDAASVTNVSNFGSNALAKYNAFVTTAMNDGKTYAATGFTRVNTDATAADYQPRMFNITFDSYKAIRDAKITAFRVKYKATVSDKMEVGSEDNTNTGYVWYCNDTAGNYVNKSDTVNGYTFATNIVKTDGNKTPSEAGYYLANAKFEMFKEAYIYTPNTSVANYSAEHFENSTGAVPPANEDSSKTNTNVYANYEFNRGANNDEFKAATNGPMITPAGESTSAEYANDAATLNGITVSHSDSKTAGKYYFRYVSSDDEQLLAVTDGPAACDICAANAVENAEQTKHYHIHAYELQILPQNRVSSTLDAKITGDATKGIKVVSTATAEGVVVKGIEPASYALIETDAPSSAYNKLTEAVVFEIKGLDDTIIEKNKVHSYTGAYLYSNISLGTDSSQITGFEDLTNVIDTGVGEAHDYYQGYLGTYKINVKNFQGIELPSTGGMGTLLFTIIGIILMMLAFIIVLLKRREVAEEF